MRIALLFSGTYRNSTELVVKLLQWFRNQENIDEVDVYMHFWWQKEFVGKRQSYQNNTIVEDDPTYDIMECIKPKKLVLEPQADIDFSSLPKKCAAGGTSFQREMAYFTSFSQMISFKRCFDLVEDYESYDLIMRIRPDLFLANEYKLDINSIKQKKNCAWIADGQFFTGWPFGDWCIVSSPQNMKLLAENWAPFFRHISIVSGAIQHIHVYLPLLFDYFNIPIERWYIPLKISRDHLLVNESLDKNTDPYFYHMIPPERFKD
jgi:hypothetical protein